MTIYLDDNIADLRLVALFTKSGHQALTPVRVSMSGKTDALQLAYAAPLGYVMMTKDHDDFLDLHQLVLATGGNHPGIVVVREDNDRKRDMSLNEIVSAFRKLLASGISLQDGFFILNHWR